MITKCTIIIMLLFSASVMPIHTEPVRNPSEFSCQGHAENIEYKIAKNNHIIKEGKTYEECMNESFNKLYKNVNVQFGGLQKPEPVEPKIEI